MRRLGCLMMIGIVLLITAEIFVAYQLMVLIGGARDPDYLGVIICLILLSVAGYQLLRWRLKSLPQAMLSGTPGHALVAAFGCILIIIPGFMTGVSGLVLQLPLFQKLLGGMMLAVFQAQMGKQMGKMAGAGFPGGGNPFAGGAHPFAGANPFGSNPGRFGGMQADDSIRKKKKTKTIDTTAKRQN